MKAVAVSELKAKLARYLRLVKGGEAIEVRERGVPIAILSAVVPASEPEFIPPRKDPGLLASYRFSASPKKKFDAVALLLEDRRRR